ncbi:MAG: hypothetical protein E7294_13750 [Lachnospiraceae bacterium]|jgi:hypothetical protein|nr:hypothetical protein [Lachnospiraceae bacterium]
MTERRVHLLSHLFGRTSAITIRNSDSNIARIIYLEGYYDMFCNGIALDDIASDIVTSFEDDETLNNPELLGYMIFSKIMKLLRTDYVYGS